MNLHLTGRTALITGASSGIGAATAALLAAEGVDCVICYHHNRHGAEQAADAVRAHGRQAWMCAMDLADPRSVQEAIGALRADVPALDIVVLCAGQNIVTPFARISAEEWNQVIAANLSGPFYMMQALEPLLREGASVVTVASVAAHTGAPHHLHYAAAKAGLVNLTKSLARALAPRVRVNCVAPGITLTAMGADTTANLEPGYAQKKLLTGRFATPEEIASWIVFVASPLSGFMTGATIDINGGRDLR